MWREQNFKYTKFGLIMEKTQTWSHCKQIWQITIIWRTPLGPLKGTNVAHFLLKKEDPF